MKKGKTIIVHDSFFIKGGAERMNVRMAQALDADIAASVFAPQSYDLGAMGFRGRKIEVFPKFKRGMIGFFRMKFAFAFRCGFLKGYDTVLFSNEAISARRGVRKDAFKAYYAHSVSRHLFDQKDDYLGKVHPFFRPFASLALVLLRIWYVADLRAMDLILTNSSKNRDFLKTLAPKVVVEVLYPPVDPEEFFPSSDGSGGYFLSYARLAHAKRVDRIISAFREIPERKLLVIYGKNDPQKGEFVALAEGMANVEFRTLEDNSEIPEIVRRATAVIAVSKNEDFGMVVTESLASGVPVIAVAEGGFLETMVDGETGTLLSPDFTDNDLARAIRSMTDEKAVFLKGACLERSKKFAICPFSDRLKALLNAKR